MNPYQVVLIDDEPLALDVLKHYLSSFDRFEIAQSFSDALAAFKYLQTNRVDLVFCDIAMPELSGTELIKALGKELSFVMVTSYSQYAIECFELNVVDYLLKPIPFERFSKTLQRFENQQQPTGKPDVSEAVFVKDGEDFIKIYLDDIDYFQGMKDYVKIVVGKQHQLALKTLKAIEEELEPKGFIRIHKSYIIPLRKINHYNGKDVIVNDQVIPVGASYRQRLKHYLDSLRF